MGIKRFAKEFLRDLLNEKYDTSEGGILLKQGLMVRGFYEHGVNGKDWIREQNLIPDAAILSILNVYFGGTAKISTWYIAPFSGSATPASNWTAANFTSNATEITSTTEGYTETPRQTFTAGSAAAGAIDNYASKAAFTIATATELDINGAGLLSVATRGGTTGVLASAIKFASTRTVQDADVWSCGYQIELTDS